MKIEKKLLMTTLLIMAVASLAVAQAPSGYYDSAKGKNKAALLSALEDIVGPHTAVSYKELFSVYKTSDVTSSGYIWDMYSTSEYDPDNDRCGNYSSVGDCFNREHSFPKSWFDDASPMYTDAYHIYPTDGKVNGQRSNYPYGECEDGTTLSSSSSVKALGKLGTSTFSGYSGIVFEPDDEYKGDFARSYFYMAAAYNSKIANWSSAQLAGNSYPCFSSWSVNLLMKWHRQDPVSQKEIDRNNAVSEWQGNRNPFIDYPELAEYIWGNCTEYGWEPGGTLNPMIVLPENGSTIDMGITGIGLELAASMTVKASDLAESLTVSLSGDATFSVDKSTISASDAMAGTTLTVKYVSSVEGKNSAVLTISSDEASVSVNLSAEATSSIPASEATNITATSFTANWIDVDYEGFYSLNVMESDASTSVSGYPVQVTTADESHDVIGLQPESTYYYQLSASDGRKSNVVTVKTAIPEKVLTFILPDGGLVFSAKPGECSDVLEAVVYTEYVTEQITATISSDFEISLDKSSWGQSAIIDSDGESVYVRMKAHDNVGEYSGILSLSTDSFEGSEVTVSGTVAETVAFLEDFEIDAADGYGSGAYTGTACEWIRESVGTYGRSGDHFHGTLAACTGKSGSRSLKMNDDKLNGAGTVSFYAAPYGTDEEAVINVVYSVDGGTTWNDIASNVTIAQGDLQLYTYTANIQGSVRIGLVQVSGKRLNIDDVAITDYKSSGVADAIARGWDAYATGNGKLTIESDGERSVEIYSFDAVKVYDEVPAYGKSIVELPQGIYIVVSDNASKKVIVK